VRTHRTPRAALRRGATVAAANWQTVVIQAVMDAVFKGVVAVPVVGGMLLAALVIGAEPPALLSLDPRDLAAAVAALLAARPATLAAFVAAVGVAVLGASVLACAVKAGTVAIVVASERAAGAAEGPIFDVMWSGTARYFSLEAFGEAVRRFGWRFVQLGALLLTVYGAAGLAYAKALLSVGTPRWGLAVLATMGAVGAVTLANALYLLTQVVIVAQDCSAGVAFRAVARLVARAPRLVARVFVAVLGVVAGATVGSLLATAALGLVGFVPLLWFAVVPLQLVAWVMRSLVLQFITVAAVGSYASVYGWVMDQEGAGALEGESVPAVSGEG
jgi:hypothetical protein